MEALRLDTLRAAHGARAAADGRPLTFARLPLPPQPSPFATASTAGADGGTRAVAPPCHRMAVTLIRNGDDPQFGPTSAFDHATARRSSSVAQRWQFRFVVHGGVLTECVIVRSRDREEEQQRGHDWPLPALVRQRADRQRRRARADVRGGRARRGGRRRAAMGTTRDCGARPGQPGILPYLCRVVPPPPRGRYGTPLDAVALAIYGGSRRCVRRVTIASPAPSRAVSWSADPAAAAARLGRGS